MWYILQTIIISIIIIATLHYAWNYIKDNYSSKKTKDLVGFQTEKYKTILDELMNKKEETVTTQFISKEEQCAMNDDLTQFMEEQMKQHET